jgi:ribosomal protein L37AE/L43A
MIGPTSPTDSGRGPWCPYCKEVRLSKVWIPPRTGTWVCRNCGWTGSPHEGGGVYEF